MTPGVGRCGSGFASNAPTGCGIVHASNGRLVHGAADTRVRCCTRGPIRAYRQFPPRSAPPGRHRPGARVARTSAANGTTCGRRQVPGSDQPAGCRQAPRTRRRGDAKRSPPPPPPAARRKGPEAGCGAAPGGGQCMRPQADGGDREACRTGHGGGRCGGSSSSSSSSSSPDLSPGDAAGGGAVPRAGRTLPHLPYGGAATRLRRAHVDTRPARSGWGSGDLRANGRAPRQAWAAVAIVGTPAAVIMCAPATGARYGTADGATCQDILNGFITVRGTFFCT